MTFVLGPGQEAGGSRVHAHALCAAVGREHGALQERGAGVASAVHKSRGHLPQSNDLYRVPRLVGDCDELAVVGVRRPQTSFDEFRYNSQSFLASSENVRAFEALRILDQLLSIRDMQKESRHSAAPPRLAQCPPRRLLSSANQHRRGENSTTPAGKTGAGRELQAPAPPRHRLWTRNGAARRCRRRRRNAILEVS